MQEEEEKMYTHYVECPKNTLSFPKKKDKAIAKHHPHLNCHFPCESQTKDEIRRSLAVKMLHDEDEKKI